MEVDPSIYSPEQLPPYQRERCNTWPARRPSEELIANALNEVIDKKGDIDFNELELGESESKNLTEMQSVVTPLSFAGKSKQPASTLASLLEDDTDVSMETSGSGVVPPLESHPSDESSKKNAACRRNPWGNLSYADLITQAILSSPERRLTLAQVYDWMVQNVAYFQDKGDTNSSAGWKNSIRHNLSLHPCFVRVQNENTGKSSWWTVNLEASRTKNKSPRRRAVSMESKAMEKKRQRVLEKRRGLLHTRPSHHISGSSTSSMLGSVGSGSQFSSETDLLHRDPRLTEPASRHDLLADLGGFDGGVGGGGLSPFSPWSTGSDPSQDPTVDESNLSRLLEDTGMLSNLDLLNNDRLDTNQNMKYQSQTSPALRSASSQSYVSPTGGGPAYRIGSRHEALSPTSYGYTQPPVWVPPPPTQLQPIALQPIGQPIGQRVRPYSGQQMPPINETSPLQAVTQAQEVANIITSVNNSNESNEAKVTQLKRLMQATKLTREQWVFVQKCLESRALRPERNSPQPEPTEPFRRRSHTTPTNIRRPTGGGGLEAARQGSSERLDFVPYIRLDAANNGVKIKQEQYSPPAYQVPQPTTFQAPQQTTYQAPQQSAYQALQQTTYQASQQTAYQASQQTTYQVPQQTTFQPDSRQLTQAVGQMSLMQNGSLASQNVVSQFVAQNSLTDIDPMSTGLDCDLDEVLRHTKGTLDFSI